ncbi:Uncharacterised protein [Mycobacterium tuberculosis]|nr:Uncharacterised protein [Mycobacterium tuberculosis]
MVVLFFVAWTNVFKQKQNFRYTLLKIHFVPLLEEQALRLRTLVVSSS